MSDQARQDAHEKRWIHRLGEGISWEDDGVTLDDGEV